MNRWTVRLHPRAFCALRTTLELHFPGEVEALYVYEALLRADEQVELCEETRVDVVRRRG